MESLYGLLVLIHVIAAVAGLGASFAMPIIANYPKTVSQIKFAMEINKNVEKTVKIGSISLLLTGLILGLINPALFTQGWYIASLLIYVAVQPITAVILPKKMKQMGQLIANHSSEEIPDEFIKIQKTTAPYNMILHSSAIILIILMSIKPF
ncbi:DUF2269 domain-containing protein [Bacillus sp. HMF5848]|uniref:DUF2269 domain-containing protein n=1 Tax=Bacillus sp. HMF5848 TaxID=2495421 RepID=UPI0021ADF189|nr:DUF2269 domain-containing protein [Bacillus sp. HMF5848]